jgi:hypothetical protein
VDETSALLSGTPTTPGNFIFRIQARSASGPQLIKTYQVAIIGITNFGSAPTPTNGTAYSFQLAVAGGTAPYTFSLVSGALPDGLTLSSTGLISGTPTTTGTFNFTIGLHDSSSNAALCQKTAALTVASNNCPDFAGKNWKDPGWYSEANSGGGILTTTFTPIPSGISFDLNAISPNSLVDTCGALSQPSFPLTPGTTCNCRAVFQCTLVGPVNERCLSFVISADAGGPYVNVALSTSAPGVYNFDIPFTLDPLATTMTVQMQVQAYCGAAGFGPMDQSRLTGTLVNV